MLNGVIGFKVNCIKYTAYTGISGAEFTVHLDFFLLTIYGSPFLDKQLHKL